MASVKEVSGVLAWQTAAANAGGRPRHEFKHLTVPLSTTPSAPQVRPQSSRTSGDEPAAAVQPPVSTLSTAQIVASAERLASKYLPTKTPPIHSKEMPASVAVNTPDASFSSSAVSLIDWEGTPQHGDSRSFPLLEQIPALVPTRTSKQLVEEPNASEPPPETEKTLIEWESPPQHGESRSLVPPKMSEQVVDGSDSHQSGPEMSLIDCGSLSRHRESSSETTNASPAIDVTQTMAYREKLLDVCRANIRRGNCENPSWCIQHASLHICPGYNADDCSPAGPGETHMGGLHTYCRGFRHRDCNRPGCWRPNTVPLLHAKYSCFSFRFNTLNPVCFKGGETGGCPEGHDNADIRAGLERSFRLKSRRVLPTA